jgi:hypothetical protein
VRRVLNDHGSRQDHGVRFELIFDAKTSALLSSRNPIIDPRAARAGPPQLGGVRVNGGVVRQIRAGNLGTAVVGAR